MALRAASRVRPAKPFKQTLRARRLTVVAKAGEDTVPGAYANALLELGQSKNALEPIHADVDALSSLLRDNKQFQQFVYNPVVTDEKKKAVFQKIAKDAGFQQYTVNFLGLLLEKGRIELLELILAEFEKEYCIATDTQVATVRSAVKLEQEQQFLIAKKLQELTGSKNIKLKPVIDQALIAGFVVEYGSASIDLSIKGQLEKITGELLAKYSENKVLA